MTDRSGQVTVGDLIAALGKLPPETLVFETFVGYMDAMTEESNVLLVHHCGSRAPELHIDDGQSARVDYIYRRRLFEYVGDR